MGNDMIKFAFWEDHSCFSVGNIYSDGQLFIHEILSALQQGQDLEYNGEKEMVPVLSEITIWWVRKDKQTHGLREKDNFQW